MSETLVSSSVDSAADACRQAMASYTRRQTDVVPLLQQAMKDDPECALAPALLGLMLHGARNKGFKSKIADSLTSSESLAKKQTLTPIEMDYIAALRHASQGDLDGMVAKITDVTHKNPTDFFAIALAQGELFWMGRLQESLAISEAVNSHWQPDTPGYVEYLGCRAFDLEEAGRYDEAERAGRESVEMNPASIWATHAVAHVMYMQGRFQDGVDWIEPQQSHWDDCNQIKFHVWWHKCLFLLDLGEHEQILTNYDHWVRNREHELTETMPDLYIDMQNGASMLWRLQQAGVDVGKRWQEMAELARLRLDDYTSPFTSAHFAVILAAVGDYDSCEKLIANMEAFTQSEEGRSHTLGDAFKLAALPAARGALAHSKGDFKMAQAVLSPARQELYRMGGSHAQQDLFFQILFDATAKASDSAATGKLLQEIEHIGFFKPETRLGYRHGANGSSGNS